MNIRQTFDLVADPMQGRMKFVPHRRRNKLPLRELRELDGEHGRSNR